MTSITVGRGHFFGGAEEERYRGGGKGSGVEREVE